MYQEERGAVLCRQEEPPTGKDDAVEMSSVELHERDFVYFPSG